MKKNILLCTEIVGWVIILALFIALFPYNVYANEDDPAPASSNSKTITSPNKLPNPYLITVEVDDHQKSPVFFTNCRRTGGTEWGQQMITVDPEQSVLDSQISFPLSSLSVPHSKTTATDQSDHVRLLAPSGKEEEYVLRGIINEKTSGGPLYVNATTVMAKRAFTPTTPSGTTLWLSLIATLVLLGGTLSYMAYKDRMRGSRKK